MARRVVGGALVTASALLGVPPSVAETTPPEPPAAPQLPLAVCAARVNDDPGDGVPDWSARPGSTAPVADPRGSRDGLDITAVTFRLTATRVYAFMSLRDLPDTMPQTDSAYGFYLWFSRGPKIARFDQVLVNPLHTTVGQTPQGFPTASVGDTIAGGPNPLDGLGGGVDTAKDVAYVYADRASLEAQLGEPLRDGDELTAITGKTVLFVGAGTTAAGVTQRPADATTVPAAEAVQTVGDDHCFAAARFDAPAVSAQHGDQVTLRATLRDDAGTPLPGRRVTLSLPGDNARSLTTAADGTVAVTLTAGAAGTYLGALRYAGDDYSGRGFGVLTLTVRPETVRFAPLKVARAGAARTVTATLTEDDPRAFARQPVDFYVNGRKAATVRTDAAGKAVFRGAKAGQQVQARYAGASGRYAAARSNTVRV